MTMRFHVLRPCTLAAAVALLLAPLAAQAAAAPEPATPANRDLARAQDLYRALTSYHALLAAADTSREQLRAVLHDATKLIQEIDTRYATAVLFSKDPQSLDDLRLLAAKAQLQGSILNARAVDLEASIGHYERLVEVLGRNPASWNERIERGARFGSAPNAGELVFEMAAVKDVVGDLQILWSAVRVVRFRPRDYSPVQRASLQLERTAGGGDAFADTAFELAKVRFVERAAKGEDEFRVVLPPGQYRVRSDEAYVVTVPFAVATQADPDPIVLTPQTFSFAFTASSELCRPTMTLNGLPVATLERIPFGTYVLDVPRSCTQRLPDKITVEPGADVILRTEPNKLDELREGQPLLMFIATPPGSTYNLRM